MMDYVDVESVCESSRSVHYASGLINLYYNVSNVSSVSNPPNILDERRLWVAPCVAHIDNERNPPIVHDSL